MIEVNSDNLIFNFSNVHPDARLTISFHRTLRLHDNVNLPCVPPAWGQFQLASLDDYKDRIPSSWKAHGGIILTMYQSDAMYLTFSGYRDNKRISPYPFAIKVLHDEINGITGQKNQSGIQSTPQDFLYYPILSWLNGHYTSKEHFKQFVAMRLHEENLVLQFLVYAMKASYYERLYPKSDHIVANFYANRWGSAPADPMKITPASESESEKWDTTNGITCFVHIANALAWTEITGQSPSHEPFTKQRYQQSSLEWRDYYNDDLKLLN